jgi:uncharacterized protein (UPF0548 family)
MWSTTPVHRWVMTGSWPEDAPPVLPEPVSHPDIQGLEDGVGPLLHRLYRTRIVATDATPAGLVGKLLEDMDRVAPTEFASFQSAEGEGPMREGDEYVVRMPGPWDGPVCVVEQGRTSFRLATLKGHLEAGQIEFRAHSDHRSVSFEIESWARSGDRLSDLLYTHAQISKEVQLHMWASVLRNVVDLAGGRMEGGIVITTRVVEPKALPQAGQGRPQKIVDPLGDIAGRPVNFDAEEIAAPSPDGGWRVDELVESLPHEPPGAPCEGGSWLVAKRIMDSYQLADPRIVEASYRPDAPLSGRDMSLRIHYGPLRFTVGVRVGEAREETFELDGREVLVFGWSYRTLEGHFEQGEMRYELRKWLDTGDVEFRLRAVSRPARSGPLLTRMGFRLFGRSHQLRFYRQVCRRLRRLTEAQLETERATASRRALHAVV